MSTNHFRVPVSPRVLPFAAGCVLSLLLVSGGCSSRVPARATPPVRVAEAPRPVEHRAVMRDADAPTPEAAVAAVEPDAPPIPTPPATEAPPAVAVAPETPAPAPDAALVAILEPEPTPAPAAPEAPTSEPDAALIAVLEPEPTPAVPVAQEAPAPVAPAEEPTPAPAVTPPPLPAPPPLPLPAPEPLSHVHRIVMLDGDTSEWPGATVALTDPHHAFFRFAVADEKYTLQAADKTTVIFVDADSDEGTGKRVTMGANTLGVDIEVQFSPRGDNGAPGRGAGVFAYEPDGDAFRMNAYDWDLSCTPTFASTWYEARFSRAPRGEVPCTTRGLLTSGTSRGAVATLDASGTPDAYSPVFTIESAGASPAPGVALSIPGKPAGAVRVVSYNVLRSSPNAKPQVFQRILGAIQPDIVLVQEWEAASETEIADWFNAMIPAHTDAGWHVVAIADTVQNGGGVAVVSRYPLTPVFEARPTVPEGATNAGKAIRIASAIADGPHGPIVLSSAHLKSGGSAGSAEDVRRLDEARTINSWRMDGAAPTPTAWRIIAGDMNLVGSWEPLEILGAGLDADGSALTAAPTQTLGDGTFTTWSERVNAFAPGRLDWLLYSDATCRAVNAFVLDTSRLADDTLARAGLTAADSAQASDHLPVVVDLVPVR